MMASDDGLDYSSSSSSAIGGNVAIARAVFSSPAIDFGNSYKIPDSVASLSSNVDSSSSAAASATAAVTSSFSTNAENDNGFSLLDDLYPTSNSSQQLNHADDGFQIGAAADDVSTSQQTSTAESFNIFDSISSTEAATATTSLQTTTADSTDYFDESYTSQMQNALAPYQSPSLTSRIVKRFMLLLNQLYAYLELQFSELSTSTIVYFSLFIVVASILVCVIINLMREEEKRIKERYRQLGARDHQYNYVAASNNSHKSNNGQYYQRVDSTDSGASIYEAQTTTTTAGDVSSSAVKRRESATVSSRSSGSRGSYGSTSRLLITRQHLSNGNAATTTSPSSPVSLGIFNSLKADFNESLNSSSHVNRQNGANSAASSSSDTLKLHIHELRRETYFGLVRLLKPGCLTVVLLCDSQSKIKLISKFYECVYPYRKNKTVQFAFLLIEKNLNWYQELLNMALNERRELQINPINCLGTVIVINGFKKYFSVYHASDSRYDPCEPFVLLEESLLDHLPDWLERLFSGKVNRYYVRYWPEKMR